MDVLGDAIARERRSGSTALVSPTAERRYDYRRFCTSAWKCGNFLSYLGVRRGSGVAVADEPLPEPVLTFYGAAALGGVVRFDSPPGIDAETRALVVPAADLNDYTFGPGTKRIVYGDRPTDPSVSYFERDVWSENPTEPPDRVESDDPLLRTAERTYSHDEILGAAFELVDRHGLVEDSVVAVRGSLADPTVVVAGLVAPIVAGAGLSIGSDAEGAVVVGGPESDVDGIEMG